MIEADYNDLTKNLNTYIHKFEIFVLHRSKTLHIYHSIVRFTCSFSATILNLLSIQILNAQILQIDHILSDLQEILRANLSVIEAEGFEVGKLRKGTHCLRIDIGTA